MPSSTPSLGDHSRYDLQVCRRFKAIIDGTTSLQLAIELGAAGYRRCESQMTSTQALEAFREVQRMYRNPQSKLCKTEIEISSVHTESLPRQITWWQYGNLLVGSRSRDRYNEHVDEGIPTDTDIYTLWLGMGADPFGQQHGSLRHIHRLHFDQWMEVETVDVDQDLLVLSSYPNRLHFVSLTTGDTHPKARWEGKVNRTLIAPPMRWIASLSED